MHPVSLHHSCQQCAIAPVSQAAEATPAQHHGAELDHRMHPCGEQYAATPTNYQECDLHGQQRQLTCVATSSLTTQAFGGGVAMLPTLHISMERPLGLN